MHTVGMRLLNIERYRKAFPYKNLFYKSISAGAFSASYAKHLALFTDLCEPLASSEYSDKVF